MLLFDFGLTNKMIGMLLDDVGEVYDLGRRTDNEISEPLVKFRGLNESTLLPISFANAARLFAFYALAMLITCVVLTFEVTIKPTQSHRDKKTKLKRRRRKNNNHANEITKVHITAHN